MKRFVILILCILVLESYEDSACFENEVMFNGNCHDVFDTVCLKSPGMRLYLGEDGLGYCDCMEGWLPFEGRCYQELTPATPLCPDQQILLLKNPIVPDFIFPGDNSDSIQRQIQFNYSCIESPCNSTSLPHSTTWNYTDDSGLCHPVPDSSKLLLDNCELSIDYYDYSLKCCEPSERLLCYFEYDEYEDDIHLFSVNPSTTKTNCRGNQIYSTYRKKCVSKTRKRGYKKNILKIN